MKRRILATLGILSTPALVFASPTDCVIKTIDFENAPDTTPFNPESQFGGQTVFLEQRYQDTSTIQTTVEDGKFWRTAFPRGCYGNTCGVQYLTKYSAEWTPSPSSFWYTVNMRLAPDFAFVKGGVLPGICGGNCDTDCNSQPSDSGGWSSRIQFGPDGALYGLVFDMDRNQGSCGTELAMLQGALPMKMTPGTWHQLEMRIEVNDPNTPNGILELYLDGNLGYQSTTMKWSNNGQVMIDNFYASMFYGGNDPSFAPNNDVYVDYDNVIFSTCRVGAPTPPPTPLPATTPPPVTPGATNPPASSASPTQSPTVSSATVPDAGNSEPQDFMTSAPGLIAMAGGVVVFIGIAVVGVRRRRGGERPAQIGMLLPGGKEAIAAIPGLRPSIAARVSQLFRSTKYAKEPGVSKYGVAAPKSRTLNISPRNSGSSAPRNGTDLAPVAVAYTPQGTLRSVAEVSVHGLTPRSSVSAHSLDGSTARGFSPRSSRARGLSSESSGKRGMSPKNSMQREMSPKNSMQRGPSPMRSAGASYQAKVLSKNGIKRQNNAITIARLATANDLYCQCDLPQAKPVPIERADLETLRSLCLSLGLPFTPADNKEKVLSRVSIHPNFKESLRSNKGKIELCRSCLKSASPPL